jgi:hypothetical protein
MINLFAGIIALISAAINTLCYSKNSDLFFRETFDPERERCTDFDFHGPLDDLEAMVDSVVFQKLDEAHRGASVKRYSAQLGGAYAEDQATTLIQMCKENLAKLHPHPIYAKFYYSHPPVVERV